VRLTTWNVNSLRMRLDQVLRFADEHQPDVLCLQELKLADDAIPVDALRTRFPEVVCWGQPAYNGVAILSKLPLHDVRRGMLDSDDAEARLLTAQVGGIRLYALYVPNGMAVGSPKFHYKLRWLGQLRAELDRLYPADTPLAVLGDLNVAPDDLDVWDPFKLDGELLCHPDERAALRHLMDWGLHDAFREKNPFANPFTWWDYQKMGFVRNHGLRIDHTLLSAPLLARLRSVTIHRDVRGWEQPSDHAPVSVDLEPA
jgi:exodeoxyribonuclease III